MWRPGHRVCACACACVCVCVCVCVRACPSEGISVLMMAFVCMCPLAAICGYPVHL